MRAVLPIPAVLFFVLTAAGSVQDNRPSSATPKFTDVAAREADFARLQEAYRDHISDLAFEAARKKFGDKK